MLPIMLPIFGRLFRILSRQHFQFENFASTIFVFENVASNMFCLRGNMSPPPSSPAITHSSWVVNWASQYGQHSHSGAGLHRLRSAPRWFGVCFSLSGASVSSAVKPPPPPSAGHSSVPVCGDQIRKLLMGSVSSVPGFPKGLRLGDALGHLLSLPRIV